jgi:DNA-binding Lrp family transcriptional regulator
MIEKTKPSGGFTYLSNHAHVLVCLSAEPELRVRDLATMVGVTERAVHRILSDLEEAGVVRRVKEGRRNRYLIERRAHLRHPLESHCTVGGLLEWVHSTPTASKKARSAA